MLIAEKNAKIAGKEYDITVFQTENFGETKGYKQVYRCKLTALDHDDALYGVFRLLNIKDLLPMTFEGRYMATGDIVFIDEGIRGHHYYQLKSGGWQKVNRIHIC